MVSEDRFEELFARVMSLVPPEELQGVLAAAPLAPLSPDNTQSVVKLVTEGFERWKSFDERYKGQRRNIRELDPGAAGWEDVREFLERHADAKRVDGFETLRFRADGNEVAEDSVGALVVSVDNECLALGETDGMPVRGRNGEVATPVGLNTDRLVRILRRFGLPDGPSGAAVLGWSLTSQALFDATALPERFGLLAFARQQFASARGYGELGGTSLELYLVLPSGEVRPLAASQKRAFVRALLSTTARRDAKDEDQELARRMRSIEEELWQQLRRPPAPSHSERILHAVTPLLAAVVTQG
jgi:hypothetical protein